MVSTAIAANSDPRMRVGMLIPFARDTATATPCVRRWCGREARDRHRPMLLEERLAHLLRAAHDHAAVFATCLAHICSTYYNAS